MIAFHQPAVSDHPKTAAVAAQDSTKHPHRSEIATTDPAARYLAAGEALAGVVLVDQQPANGVVVA